MAGDVNEKPDFDQVIQDISDYVADYDVEDDISYETARYCLMDALACGLLALPFEDAQQVIDPLPGIGVEEGIPIPGTGLRCEPQAATFSLGAMIRWLDYNDTWLAREWGHPSDNIAAILSMMTFINQSMEDSNLTVRDALELIVKAYEIQGVLALENCFNEVGLDHVILVKVASAAVVSEILGGDRDDIMNTVSNAWLDGHPLRTYRHAPNTGSRKSWAAGDAASRAVKLALLTTMGEQGYPSALTAEKWGFQDALFRGKEVVLKQELAEYVIQNILFKISFPAEFHGQTAVEAAIQLHPEIIDDIDKISKITIKTQEPAMRIINKTGPLHNAADRDHCIQYMVAVALLEGDLTSEYYQDDYAEDERIDQLREKMEVIEEPKFSEEYLDPDKRSIANSLQVHFADESSSNEVTISYPIGHKRRRKQAIPILKDKFKHAVQEAYSEEQANKIIGLFNDVDALDNTPVDQLMELLFVQP